MLDRVGGLLLSDVRSSCQAAALVEMKHGFFERDGSAMETVAGHVEWARQLPAVPAGSEQYGRDACAVLVLRTKLHSDVIHWSTDKPRVAQR